MIHLSYIIGFFLSASIGYLLYRVVVLCIPTTLTKQPKNQAKNIIQEAKKQQSHIHSQSPNKETLAIAKEELKADIESLKSTLREDQELLDKRETKLAKEKKRLTKLENIMTQQQTNTDTAKEQYQRIHSRWQTSQDNLQEKLAQKCHMQASTLKEQTKNHYLEEKTLEYQKILRFMETEMQAQAKKKADLMLRSIHTRYSPDFVWPKATHVISEKKKGDIETFLSKHPHLLEEIQEISEVTASPVMAKETPVGVKFAGGFGIFREAAKLAFTDLYSGKKDIRKLYNHHRDLLNQEARELGNIAIKDLRLLDIHPEIQYLIGSLNWRTSYRQNQWLHTMEVAVLAGLLAEELGMDPQAAKRCGLLHDIGKAVDYRIEGSHAIISGDYADRFGESKLICDTVMSHHSDLIVESPLAFTLMAADTLSGARPGARVNIEEGYQLRLSAITEAVRSFAGVSDIAVMNGGREVHINVNHRTVSEQKSRDLAYDIARKIEQDVSYPSQIKVQVSRTMESQAVA